MFKSAVVLCSLFVAMTFYRVLQPIAPRSPSVVAFFALEPEPITAAFFIECRNSGDAPLSSASREWVESADAVRIDGVSLAEPGGVVLPGLSEEIPPGGIWRGIIEVRGSRPKTSFAPV